MSSEKNIHSGHRNRLREKFSKFGLEGFNEHEVLEMLLFDCIPMKNTNEIAHDLINHYGSLWQVFEAHPEELKNFKGMTYAAACSVSQYMRVQKFVEVDRLKNNTVLATIGQAKGYFRQLLHRARKEEFYLICLNAKNEVLLRLKIREGSVNKVVIDIREIAEAVCRHNATSILIAHSHPSGSAAPSMSDDDFSRNLFVAMSLISINFLDHVIIGGEDLYSYWEHNRLNEFRKDLAHITRTPFSNVSDMLAQNKFLHTFYEGSEEKKHELKTV